MFRQSGISDKLRIGKRLIQATETTFETFYNVSERLIESANDVSEIIEEEGKKRYIFASNRFISLGLNNRTHHFLHFLLPFIYITG